MMKPMIEDSSPAADLLGDLPEANPSVAQSGTQPILKISQDSEPALSGSESEAMSLVAETAQPARNGDVRDVPKSRRDTRTMTVHVQNSIADNFRMVAKSRNTTAHKLLLEFIHATVGEYGSEDSMEQEKQRRQRDEALRRLQARTRSEP